MAECRILPSGQRIFYNPDLSGMEITDKTGNIVAVIPADVILGIMATYLRSEMISAIECAEDAEILARWNRR